MVGIAGSGKTAIAKRLFPNHKRVSLDEIHNSDREVEYSIIKQNLDNGNNVVIDDTNLTKNIRFRHIELAKKHHAKIKAIFLDLPLWIIQEQNKRRENPLPDSALFRMQKQLEIPTEVEGIDFVQILKSSLNDL